MRPELEHVPKPGYGDCTRSRDQRSLLNGLHLVANDDLVDLVEIES
jgi:hypothetical protein